jgi:hypothetical protein
MASFDAVDDASEIDEGSHNGSVAKLCMKRLWRGVAVRFELRDWLIVVSELHCESRYNLQGCMLFGR